MKNLNLKRVNTFVFGMLFIAFLFATLSIFGQDVIIKNDKTEIQAKIMEIQEKVIKYKLFNYLDGPIRNINVLDVFMIIYENGARETFDVPIPKILPEQQIVQEQQPVIKQSPIPTPPKPKPLFLHDGFCYGLKAGLFIPSNKTVSEIYGPGFMWGGSIGYWAGRWGIVFDYRSYSKKGDPYTLGQVSSATSKLSLLPLTFTNYFTIIKSGYFETYVGLGVGTCFYKEYLSMTALGQRKTTTEKLITLELNATWGMNIYLFYFEFSLISIPLFDYNTNVGGFLFSVGYFI
jgi:hypothetical protein